MEGNGIIPNNFFYIKVRMQNFRNLVTLDFKENFVGADQ